LSRLLVVEDEPNLRTLLVRLLESAGHQVCAVATGSDGLHAALGSTYDLILLDLMLPDLTGEEILHILRTVRPEAKVLILSSVTDVGRRVGVLDGGAADFVAKPFVNAELLARIRLRLRDETVRDAPGSYLSIDGQAHLDIHRREVMVGDRRVPLSQREFTLLAHLLQRKGETCSREELLADVWGLGFDPGTNVVDVYVGRLRAKLERDVIETVRNIGYRLVA
jgi:two-component system OmpR family response regulator